MDSCTLQIPFAGIRRTATSQLDIIMYLITMVKLKRALLLFIVSNNSSFCNKKVSYPYIWQVRGGFPEPNIFTN